MKSLVPEYHEIWEDPTSTQIPKNGRCQCDVLGGCPTVQKDYQW